MISNVQGEMTAVRVSFTWMGTKRALTKTQMDTAAASFDADRKMLGASKKILDTKHIAFKNVNKVKSQTMDFVKNNSLPFPEDGIRLIRTDSVESFEKKMTEFASELTTAVNALSECFEEIKADARKRLGDLYNPADYPVTINSGLFSIEWSYPSIEPPAHLLKLNGALYEKEKARIAAKFDVAAQMAEDAFTDEFAKMIEHLQERLAGTEDGKPKTFKEASIGNLKDFFKKFELLNVTNNQKLNDLVKAANDAVDGVDAKTVRSNDFLRNKLQGAISNIGQQLNGLLSDKPARKIKIVKQAAPETVNVSDTAGTIGIPELVGAA